MTFASTLDGTTHKLFPLEGDDFLMKGGRTGRYYLSVFAAPDRPLSRGEAAKVLRSWRKNRTKTSLFVQEDSACQTKLPS